MMDTNNPFKRYTLAIAEEYANTAEQIAKAQQKPPKRKYTSFETMLQECVFLGATRFGTNFIC